MKHTLLAGSVLFLTIASVGCQEQPSVAPAPPGAEPPKKGWEYTPEDFGIGHKMTPNDWCNQQIDKLREETRTCFNTRAAADCDALQKANADKIGGYVRARRCQK